MGLIFLDSFDDRYFATGTSYATYHAKWNVVSEDSSGGYLLEQVTGSTGKACKLGGTSYLQKTGLAIPTGNPLTWGYALKVESAPVSDTVITSITFTDGTTNVVGTLNFILTPTLYFKIVHNTGSDFTLATSTSALNLNTFYYLESTVYDNSVNLYKDGSNWLSVANVSPVSMLEPTLDYFKISGGVIIDDLYLKNDNVKLGAIKIDAVVPTSNGTADTNAWSSVDYQDVDECFQANNDGNSSYDQSNTASPSRVSYNFPDISVNSLKGVQTLSWVAGYWNGTGSATNVNMTAITRVSSTYYESNTKSCSSSTTPTYVLLVGLWENNPNTSTAWTSSTYNGAEFGVKAAPSSNNLGRLTAITIEAAYDYTTTPPASSRIFIIS